MYVMKKNETDKNEEQIKRTENREYQPNAIT